MRLEDLERIWKVAWKRKASYAAMAQPKYCYIEFPEDMPAPSNSMEGSLVVRSPLGHVKEAPFMIQALYLSWVSLSLLLPFALREGDFRVAFPS